jgi:hypothetical protein
MEKRTPTPLNIWLLLVVVQVGPGSRVGGPILGKGAAALAVTKPFQQ